MDIALNGFYDLKLEDFLLSQAIRTSYSALFSLNPGTNPSPPFRLLYPVFAKTITPIILIFHEGFFAVDGSCTFCDPPSQQGFIYNSITFFPIFISGYMTVCDTYFMMRAQTTDT
jgi:hypothetical protein